jgi:hypothetical protein
LALIGTSQTRRSLDPERVLAALGDEPHAPFAFNLGMDGIHPCAYPYFVRRLLDDGAVDTIVLELAWIGHDQYQGIRFVRRYVEDTEVRDALGRNAVAAAYLRPVDRAAWFPLGGLGAECRNAFDNASRHAAIRDGTAARAQRGGWSPVTHRKDAGELVVELNELYAENPDAIEDRFASDGLLAALLLSARICEERGVRLVCLEPPVNRAIAPDVPILRHFEQALRDDVIPVLRARGTAVLVPPDRFFEPQWFSDHVHLHADAAADFSIWLGTELRALR